MSPKSAVFAAALLCAAVIPLAAAAVEPAGAADARFDALVDDYYSGFSTAHPSSATAVGLHDHDSDLDDYSQAGIQKEVARLRSWDAKFGGIDGKQLDARRSADLVFVRSAISSSLLELNEVQSWRHRPDAYPDVASQAVYVIMKRDYAPAAERLRAVIAREQKIPTLLASGQKNLRDVPKVYLDIALDQMEGTLGFFKNDVPLAFSQVKDPQLLGELGQATAKVVAALNDYTAFLKREIAPRAKKEFALGEALFRKKLHADEMIDTPLDELLQRGEAELHRLQAEFKGTAAGIDPKRPFAEVQAEMSKDHGTAAHLLDETRSRLAGLKKFLVEKELVSVPSDVMPRVEETPPFMRATTFASMDTPGAFERKATEAYYNITLPDPRWPAAQAEDFLRGAFNRSLIDVVSIHEAFPGHYVQFLWLPHIASKVRKFESVSSNAEGWAHYCEQMMLDEGYGGTSNPRLRLAQLQDAMLRAARYVVGIRMHTRGMTFDQAVEFFQKEGFQAKKVAEMETRRGTEDPTYLYYTAGKLEILKLREDYKKKLGPAFSLRKFHDALLKEGAIPLPLVRKALLAN